MLFLAFMSRSVVECVIQSLRLWICMRSTLDGVQRLEGILHLLDARLLAGGRNLGCQELLGGFELGDEIADDTLSAPVGGRGVDQRRARREEALQNLFDLGSLGRRVTDIECTRGAEADHRDGFARGGILRVSSGRGLDSSRRRPGGGSREQRGAGEEKGVAAIDQRSPEKLGLVSGSMLDHPRSHRQAPERRYCDSCVFWSTAGKPPSAVMTRCLKYQCPLRLT